MKMLVKASFALFKKYDILTDGETSGVPADDGDARKMVSLLEECSLQTEESVPHLSAAFAYLGASYLLGEGCARDFDKAHDAFVKANELGFDCSNHLSRFKKKLFGGWDSNSSPLWKWAFTPALLVGLER